jgi:hypothetical protein
MASLLVKMHGFPKKPMHIGIAGSRSVPQHLQQLLTTFRWRTVSPHPQRRPNMKENRNNSMMFRALRLPPPAANGNRPSSTAQSGQCLCVSIVTWSYPIFLFYELYMCGNWKWAASL